MSRGAIVQYVGFEANAIAREYSFLVREPPGEPREFTLTIVNEAFDTHRVRYPPVLPGKLLAGSGEWKWLRRSVSRSLDTNGSMVSTITLAIAD